MCCPLQGRPVLRHLLVYTISSGSSLIEISAEGARLLGEVAATLADAESLEAHGLSARLRLRDGD